MKKLLLVPIALFSLGISAQSSLQLKNLGTSLVVAPNEVIMATTSPYGNTKVNLDFKNTSTSAKTYNVKRYDVLLHIAQPDTAAAYFCFGGFCYGVTTKVSPNTLVLQAGKSASDTSAAYCILSADLDEISKVGVSVVKYTFFNVNNTSDSVQITIRYNGYVGINKVNNDVTSFEIFPNPAVENAFLKVNAAKAFDSKVTVYNTLGAVVSEKPAYISEGKNNLDLKIEMLPAGLYFVNIKTGESAVTRRLVVK